MPRSRPWTCGWRHSCVCSAMRPPTAAPRPTRTAGSVWLRAHVEQQLDGALQAAQLFAARSLWSGVRMEVGVGRLQGTPGATFTLSLSSYLPAVRTLTLVSAPTVGGSPTASQFVQG